MTYQQFVAELARRLSEAEKKALQDMPAINAAIEWARSIIVESEWGEKDVHGFLKDVGRHLGIDTPEDTDTGWIKRSQSNTAFMALLAKGESLAQSAKSGK